MKGIEGLPFKYIVMIIAAAIVVGALMMAIDMLTVTAKATTQSANETLLDALNNSLAKAVNRTP
ncbi:MAG: hypothetical protein ACE5J7_03845 [Candidatus Aenigmatarchaeota archaeon]